MSLAPFAAHQHRVNSAVLARLADSLAVVGEGEPFGVIFQQPYSSPFEGQLDAAAPTCLGPASALGALQRDDAITINGAPYTVLTAEPDGAGMVLLTLASGAGGFGG